MPSLNLAPTALMASFAGYLFLKKYEPTDPPLLASLLLIPPLIIALLHEEPHGAFGSILQSYSLYYFGLLSWIITYRICPLHPLWKYPGPMACKISKIWLTFVGSRGKLHLYVKELHEKHGPVIRIGPNELSITDVSLLPSILGSSGMPKGPRMMPFTMLDSSDSFSEVWDGRIIISRTDRKKATVKNAARGALINARDLKVHAESRKTWNRAFIPAAIKGYEPMLIRRVAQLVEALDARTGTSVDLSQWLSFFSFDFMGDIAFGGGFELMREGDKDGLWHIMERGLYLPALTQQIPWVIGFIPYFSMAGKREKDALGKFASDQAMRRLREGSVHNDLFYYLMDAKPADSKPQPLPLVVSNAVLAIIAGSDTSATVLSNIFFFLLSHPESYKRLRLEIDETFPLGKEPTEPALLSSLPYLTAVIKESLRLFPPVATSLQRAPMVGTGSKVLSESFVIPEGTSVVVPPYTIHRDPRNFSPSPDKYIPDRWLAKDNDPEFVTNDDAFIPFSMGPANCVGKNLAMLEIRMVVAHIMQAFELQFSDGYDTQRWEEDMKDYFVMQKGSLPINLTRRAT
ncbi:hypothetical protein MSAN_02407100 [Mycena sanguinolenta]|uniref:Cytochrome P450 n=1 Tax=Mycena sanguinolenta TaxID=230812 RepID=A0A8H7CEM8_9AGAR|nr:hypothetical protein MSAN_02407100 [Mycena sanguinolenta]